MLIDRLRITTSRSGHTNVEVDGLPYHSAYDPEGECRKFYSALSLEKVDVVLHFGWGLGYSGAVLQQRLKPSARILVLEPDEDLFKLFCSETKNAHLLKDERFQFVVGDQARRFFDTWNLNQCQENDNFLWIEWPAAARLQPELANSLKASFRTQLRDTAANLLTHFQNGKTYFTNAIANFRYAADPVAGRLFNKFTGVPLVLVSAGPSLDRNIRYLAGLESRCFILAVDTALRPLLAAGIIPHAVVMADPSALNARHVIGAMPPETFLIAEQAVDPAAMAAASKRFLFSVGVYPDSLFREFDLPRTPIEVWGSVATAALNLACDFGCNPIIMAGQDFAYSWGRDYASHTIYHNDVFEAHSPRFVHVPDVWGRMVPTTENLVAYRDYFVRRFRATQGIRFINATEGGILSEGVELLPLRDAIYQACGPTLPIRQTLEDCHKVQQRSLDLKGHLQLVLSSRSTRCGCLDGFLELVAKEALMKRDAAGIESAIGWGLSEL